MFRKTAAVFLLSAILFLPSCSGYVTVLSYNVENLFDDHSGGGEYPEYSGQRWTEELYSRKLAAIARALKAAARRGADILCLQELESELALRDLRDRHLAGFGYRYLVFVPQEHLATSVACLSRVPIRGTRVHEVGNFGGVPLRHILELQVEYEGSILYLFNNHWKSKTGGVERTAPARRRAAAVLSNRLREILRSDPAADILVLGDLNENLDEYLQAEGRYRTAIVPYGALASTPQTRTGAFDSDALFTTPEAGQAGLRGDRVVLYDPWYELPAQQRGSAVYQNSWQTPDHILLSSGLLDPRGFSYSPGDFRVIRADFLLDPQTGLPRLWRHDRGGSGGGTSDHLPLVLTVHTR